MIAMKVELLGVDPETVLSELRRVFEIPYDLYDDRGGGVLSVRARLRQQENTL
jgi:hypothetical protein